MSPIKLISLEPSNHLGVFWVSVVIRLLWRYIHQEAKRSNRFTISGFIQTHIPDYEEKILRNNVTGAYSGDQHITLASMLCMYSQSSARRLQIPFGDGLCCVTVEIPFRFGYHTFSLIVVSFRHSNFIRGVGRE